MTYRILSTLLFAATASVPLAAQQPFLSPPSLSAPTVPGVFKASPADSSGCQPSGDVSEENNVTTVNLIVKEKPNEIFNPATGRKEPVLLRSYGGCLSGPLLAIHPGSTLRVHLDNELAKADPSCPAGVDPPDGSPGCFNTINLHFHGLHVSPSGNSDNVLLNIAPSTSFDYEVNVPGDHPSGTFWYHAHRHGSTAMQVASGASGILIIRGMRPYVGKAPGDIDTILHSSPNHNFPEQFMLFQQIPYGCFTDATLTTLIKNGDGTWSCPVGKTGVVENFSQVGSADGWDLSGRFTSINGVVQPTIQGVKAGVVQRWRMVHGGIHDTVNLQIVPMASSVPAADNNTLQAALLGKFSGTLAQQAETLKEVCPSTSTPDNPVPMVPQFEIATDGLTRTSIRSIGLDKDGKPQTSVSGGIGTNFMQPGYRSDVLLVFPHEGTYCVLNQAATPAERAHNGKGGGQGTSDTQLLATVIVKGGTAVTVPSETYIRQVLYDGNKDLPTAAREGLKHGDLTPWRGMETELATAKDVSPDVQKVDFSITSLPFTGAIPSGTPAFTQKAPPLGKWSAFGFFVNDKIYDPDRIDFTRQVGSTDDWVLTSQGEPHIFHIHVNPFEVMDVMHNGESIFDPVTHECNSKADAVGVENQYCGMWHTFKDTVFVQNDYEVHIRTQYVRYIGEFVIHCHILDHEDGGMMTNVQIVPALGAPGNGIGMPGMHHGTHPEMINNPGMPMSSP